jgi:signal recognition particle subunit SEC65
MSEKRPLVIYSEYFDFNLKRSQGRKVPLNQCVKKPTIDEIFLIIKKLSPSVKKSTKLYPSNCQSSTGCLLIDYSGTKVSLLHEVGKGLKTLRKTN